MPAKTSNHHFKSRDRFKPSVLRRCSKRLRRRRSQRHPSLKGASPRTLSPCGSPQPTGKGTRPVETCARIFKSPQLRDRFRKYCSELRVEAPTFCFECLSASCLCTRGGKQSRAAKKQALPLETVKAQLKKLVIKFLLEIKPFDSSLPLEIEEAYFFDPFSSKQQGDENASPRQVRRKKKRVRKKKRKGVRKASIELVAHDSCNSGSEPDATVRKESCNSGSSSDTSSASAECKKAPSIAPTSRFARLLDLARPGSFVVIDIDDTVVCTKKSPCMLLSSRGVQQFQKYVHHHPKGFDFATKSAHCARLRDALMSKECVEAEIPDIITELQDRGCWVFGFTARYAEYSSRTDRVLMGLGIDFTRTSPLPPGEDIPDPAGRFLISNGIVYCNGLDKGPLLDEILIKMCFAGLERGSPYLPSDIILIDDRMYNLRSFQANLVNVNALGIAATCVLYAPEERVAKGFDQAVLQVQMDALIDSCEVVSDAEARASVKKVSQDGKDVVKRASGDEENKAARGNGEGGASPVTAVTGKAVV